MWAKVPCVGRYPKRRTSNGAGSRGVVMSMQEGGDMGWEIYLAESEQWRHVNRGRYTRVESG